MTTWYSVHCKNTRFFEFLGLLYEFFCCWKKLGFGGLGLGLGVLEFWGREGALARALIYYIYTIYMDYIKIRLCFSKFQVFPFSVCQ